uniref:Uncharacterized protein n=1 Tax=Rhizophora mucronata TaxID=61149 RepID=A0A2P2Q086_RHIMU
MNHSALLLTKFGVQKSSIVLAKTILNTSI